MRILQVSNFAEQLGGAEVHMHQLMEALEGLGNEVALFAGSEQTDEKTPRRRVVKRPIWSPPDLISDAPIEQAFEEFLEEFRPDLIHLHNASHLPPAMIQRMGRNRAPVLMTVHDASVVCANSWLVWGDGTPCSGGIGDKCLKNGCEQNYPIDARAIFTGRTRTDTLQASVDAFVAPSRWLATRIAENGFQNVRCLPYWIEPPAAASGPAETSVQRDPDLAVFIGRLAPEKGLDVLLRAWVLVLAQRPQARLELTGSGPEEQRLRALSDELGLQTDRIFKGRVPHTKIAAIQQQAAVLVIPSIWGENSPVSIYESYVAGLPMIASDIGGIPEMVREGETGLLARPRDPEHLALRLLELLGDVDLQARLSAGCRASVERFSRAIHLEQLLPLYDELLNNADRLAAKRPQLPAEQLATADAMMRQLAQTEKWALDMNDHLKYLEQEGVAGKPVKHFARHLKYLLRRRKNSG